MKKALTMLQQNFQRSSVWEEYRGGQVKKRLRDAGSGKNFLFCPNTLANNAIAATSAIMLNPGKEHYRFMQIGEGYDDLEVEGSFWMMLLV